MDGDLLSQYVHLPHDVQAEIAEGLGRLSGRVLKRAAIVALVRDGSVPFLGKPL